MTSVALILVGLAAAFGALALFAGYPVAAVGFACAAVALLACALWTEEDTDG